MNFIALIYLWNCFTCIEAENENPLNSFNCCKKEKEEIEEQAMKKLATVTA